MLRGRFQLYGHAQRYRLHCDLSNFNGAVWALPRTILAVTYRGRIVEWDILKSFKCVSKMWMGKMVSIYMWCVHCTLGCLRLYLHVGIRILSKFFWRICIFRWFHSDSTIKHICNIYCIKSSQYREMLYNDKKRNISLYECTSRQERINEET